MPDSIIAQDSTSEAVRHGSPVDPSPDIISLLGLRRGLPYNPTDLAKLASGMANAPDTPSDGPDPEENLYMPAGYTYLGQFVDHDLTLDTTSTLDLTIPPDSPAVLPNNLRTPRFDLDCVYGNGPDDQPYLYVQGAQPTVFEPAPGATTGKGVTLYPGASLLPGGAAGPQVPGLNEAHDLLRSFNGRAIIGDKRNDENSIVNQIQQLFIAFHNRVVETLANRNPTLQQPVNAGKLFAAARDQVRWGYQRVLIEDFLPRVIDDQVLDSFVQTFRENFGKQDNPAFKLFQRELRTGIPREFSGAAYRFGHSAVRLGYRLSKIKLRPVFPNPGSPPDQNSDSLVGFQPLPADHVIDDWGRFFPTEALPSGARLEANFGPQFDFDPTKIRPEQTQVRLQYAYKLDPSLVEPLIHLPSAIAKPSDIQPPGIQPKDGGPSLALLNLLRGNRYEIASGQDFEDALELGAEFALDPVKYLRVRINIAPDGASKLYVFQHISTLMPKDSTQPLASVFNNNTPLWFYVLAEAQKPLVDLWWARNGGVINDGDIARSKPLTEDDLKHLKSIDQDGTTTQTSLAEADTQGRPLRADGTRLGTIGGRIVAEVFYGLLESDQESVFNRRGQGGLDDFVPIWGGGPASMAQLIRFANQQGKGFSDTPLSRTFPTPA